MRASLSVLRSLTRLLLVAALAHAGPAIARSADRLADEQVFAAAGRTFFLREELDRAVFEDPDFIAQLKRVGLAQGCPLILAARTDAENAVLDRFTPFMIAVMREELPGEVIERSLNNGVGVVGPWRERIERRIRSTGANPVADAQQLMLDPLRAQLSSLPDESGDWSGRYSDWNFDQPSTHVYRVACIAEAAPDPGSVKRAFDGFYQMRGN